MNQILVVLVVLSALAAPALSAATPEAILLYPNAQPLKMNLICEELKPDPAELVRVRRLASGMVVTVSSLTKQIWAYQTSEKQAAVMAGDVDEWNCGGELIFFRRRFSDSEYPYEAALFRWIPQQSGFDGYASRLFRRVPNPLVPTILARFRQEYFTPRQRAYERLSVLVSKLERGQSLRQALPGVRVRINQQAVQTDAEYSRVAKALVAAKSEIDRDRLLYYTAPPQWGYGWTTFVGHTSVLVAMDRQGLIHLVQLEDQR